MSTARTPLETAMLLDDQKGEARISPRFDQMDRGAPAGSSLMMQLVCKKCLSTQRSNSTGAVVMWNKSINKAQGEPQTLANATISSFTDMHS